MDFADIILEFKENITYENLKNSFEKQTIHKR